MPRDLGIGLQAFEFITTTGLKRLEFTGALVDWETEHAPGLVEHQILKRDGAIHQNQGGRPRKFVYRCVYLGKDSGDRYKATADALEEDPFGKLIDPRWGTVNAVWEGMKTQESPQDGIGEINFTLKFSETALRTAPRESAGSVAAGAMSKAQSFGAGAPASFVVLSAAVRIVVVNLVSQIAAAVSVPQQIELQRTLGEVQARTEAARVEAQRIGRYDLYLDALALEAAALRTYNAAAAGRPTVITHTVEVDTSLARLCAVLYGGRWARAMAEEILQLNPGRIPRPLRIPGQTRLLISNPDEVRRALG